MLFPLRTVTLANGLRVLIRPIRADDKAELQRGLKRLSAETVYRRFLAAKPRLTSSELRYFTEVDNHDHIAPVAAEPHLPPPSALLHRGRHPRPHRPCGRGAALPPPDRRRGACGPAARRARHCRVGDRPRRPAAGPRTRRPGE